MFLFVVACRLLLIVAVILVDVAFHTSSSLESSHSPRAEARISCVEGIKTLPKENTKKKRRIPVYGIYLYYSITHSRTHTYTHAQTRTEDKEAKPAEREWVHFSGCSDGSRTSILTHTEQSRNRQAGEYRACAVGARYDALSGLGL